jgi:prepilin-type N-terminal cleavage/methylation domain-containing protein
MTTRPPQEAANRTEKSAPDVPLATPPADGNGFTLIETIVGVVILSLGILAVASLSSTSLWQVQRGQDLTNSAVAVQQILEDIADTPFDSVDAGKYSDTITVGGTTYTVTWEVVDASDSLASGGSEIKLVTAYVGGGMTQTRPEQFDMAIYRSGS